MVHGETEPARDTSPLPPQPSGGVSIGSQTAGLINNVTGDQTNYYEEKPPIIPAPSRLSKVVIGLGIVLTLAGFASFGFAVLSMVLSIFQQVQSQSSAPPSFSNILLPWLPLGAVLMFAGLAVFTIAPFVWKRR